MLIFKKGGRLKIWVATKRVNRDVHGQPPEPFWHDKVELNLRLSQYTFQVFTQVAAWKFPASSTRYLLSIFHLANFVISHIPVSET